MVIHPTKLTMYLIAAVSVFAVMAACAGSDGDHDELIAASTTVLALSESEAAATLSDSVAQSPQPLLLLNQQLVEGYSEKDLDPRNINAMF